MKELQHICALIPTYNNGGTILDIVRRVAAEMNDIIYSYEDDAAKYEARKQELKDKAGIEISLI